MSLVFGEHLALVSHAWEGQDFHGHLLPPGLDAVEVLVNGEAVPVVLRWTWRDAPR